MCLRALYGVAGLGPVQLARELTSVTGSCAIVLENKLYKTGPLTNRVPIVFGGLRQFLNHCHRIKKSYIAFVVDVPEKLADVQGLLSLGYVRLKEHFAYTSLNASDLKLALDESLTNEAIIWKYVPTNVIHNALSKEKTGDSLSKIRTLVYKCLDKEDRKRSLSVVHRFLTNKIGINAAAKALRKSLSKDLAPRVLVQLSSKETKRLKTAFKKYSDSPSSIEEVCKRYKVEAFSLRYLEAKMKGR